MKLERVLSQRHVISLAFGAMVGWSWILLSGHWIERAGTLGAALAFVIAGSVMVLIALTYAELAAAMPRLGGEHVYTRRAFGPRWSFVCTWALLFGYVSVIAFEAVAFPVALSFLFPELARGRLYQVAGADVYLSHVLIGITAAITVTAINVRGLASAARLQGLATAMVVAVGLFLLAGAVKTGSAVNMAPQFTNGMAGIFAVMVMVPLMFVGFDVIPQAAEEIRLPPARIGRTVIYSVCCAVLWYALIVLAVGLVLPASARQQALPTAHAAATAWQWPGAATLMVCGGIAGIITTWNAFLVGASRLMFVLVNDGQLPAMMLSADRASLTRPLWLLCALSCLAPWCGRPALVWLVDAGSLGVVTAYAIVSLSLIQLRRKEPDMPRPYRLPHGELLAGLAFVASLTLAALYLPFSPAALIWPQEWLLCLAWIGLGVALFLGARGQRT